MYTEEEFVKARDELYKKFVDKINKDFTIEYRRFFETSIRLIKNNREFYVVFGDKSVDIIFMEKDKRVIILEFEGGNWLFRNDSNGNKSVFDDEKLDRVLSRFNLYSDIGRTE